MRPEDMDLQKELKDLSARDTMAKGKYGTAKSFRDSIRDVDTQQRLARRRAQRPDRRFPGPQGKGSRSGMAKRPGDLVLFSKFIDMLRSH